MKRRNLFASAAALAVLPALQAGASPRSNTELELRAAEKARTSNPEQPGVLMVKTGREVREITARIIGEHGNYRVEYGVVPIVTIYGQDGPRTFAVSA